MEGLNYNQKTFGNKNEWAGKKLKVLVTNPEGTITMKAFDDQPNKLALIVTLFPESVPLNSLTVLKALKNVQIHHGECPDDENFWVWWVNTRKGRVATVHHDFMVMIQYLQMAGYYSKSFMTMLLNYRLKMRDGVKKGDTILTENEIAYIIRKQYDLNTGDGRVKQKALDTFVLALFTGARVADVRTIVKSTDEVGNPVLLYHNRKGTRSHSVAWNPAVEGALERKLYITQGKNSIMYAALRAALYEALPSSSNRLINYYYLRPGKGRELKTDSRISHITFHAARHTFCTRLLRIGISPAIVAQLAGHKNIQTTMKYYNWTKETEANNVLRDVYGVKSLATEKPEWGEGAKLNPIPAEIHAAQLPQAQIGTPLNNDAGVLADLKKKRRKPPSKRQKEWVAKLKSQGIL